MIEGVALGVLMGAAWPLARVCSSPPFWRTFPHLGVKATRLLGAYAAFLTLLALFFPQALLPFAVGAGVVWLLLGWRARPGYGQRRGLPPGSLMPLPLGPWFDEQYFYNQAAQHGPIFKTSYFFKPMVCIIGLPTGLDLLQRHDETLGTPPLPFSRFIPGGYLRYMDPAVHQDYKRIFRAIFSPEVVRASHPFFEADMRAGLDQMAATCAGQDPTVGVRPKPYLNQMLFVTWVRLFTGLAPGSEEVEQLHHFFQTIDMRNPQHASDKAIDRALDDIAAIMHRQMALFSQLEQEGQTVPPCFLSELARLCPPAEHTPTVMRNFIYLLHVTWSDVAGLLLWLLKMLSDHPAWLAQIAASPPGVDAAEKLPERIVLETLRLEQSEHLYRRVTQDLHFEGFMIPKGWIVRICVRESHQNPEAFAQPERFDPDRFLDKPYTMTDYCPFGAYRLACLGQFLTKMVGKVFVEVLAREYDLHVTGDSPRVFGRWRHWRPGINFRVHVRPRR